ncbi:MAG: Stp1/IreP family PP2C-type Ser/Thr phosphatase [Acidimicrobiales bacterium]
MSKLLVGSATDVGLVRAINQDQLLVSPGLYAVADGMGGHAAGEVASATAIKALEAAFEASDQRSAESLLGAAKAANRAVWEQARANRGMFGMGTTLVAMAVVERHDGTNGLAVAHIGDSRLYLLRDGAMHQLTVDHTLVQELVDDGEISPAQAAVHPQRHVLTRVLGVEPAADLDLIDLRPQHGDRYLLCSDGLPRETAGEHIAAVLGRFSDPTEAATQLVALAKSRGGSDNITVIVVDVLANDSSPDSLIVVPGPASSAHRHLVDGGREGSTGPASAPEVPDPAADGGSSTGGPSAWGRGRASTGLTALSGYPTLASPAPGTPGPSPPAPAQPPEEPVHLDASLPRRVTWRVVGFVAAACVVIGAAIGCLGWYARSAYFVTISHGRITIFQGRPGGVLWFQPTLVTRTAYTPASVLAYNLASLGPGQPEASLKQAQLYIHRLVSEEREAEATTPASARGAPRSHPATSTATTAPRHPKHKSASK